MEKNVVYMTEEEYKKEYDKIRPFIDDCWGNPLNGDLEKEYKSLTLPKFQSSDIEHEQKLSCPLFIHLGQHYEAGKGIFIIGQETHSWGGNPETIGNSLFSFKNAKCKHKEKTLMEVQSEWLLMHYQYYIDSDFHNAVKAITGETTGKGFLESQFVWDDLIAMDYGGGSFKSLEKEYRPGLIEFSKQKLRMELAVAKPKFAIFLIGSYADGSQGFSNFFSKKEVKDIHEVKDCPNLNQFTLDFCENHENIQIECYATSHPSYKGWVNKEDVLRKLAETVKVNQTK